MFFFYSLSYLQIRTAIRQNDFVSLQLVPVGTAYGNVCKLFGVHHSLKTGHQPILVALVLRVLHLKTQKNILLKCIQIKYRETYKKEKTVFECWVNGRTISHWYYFPRKERPQNIYEIKEEMLQSTTIITSSYYCDD